MSSSSRRLWIKASALGGDLRIYLVPYDLPIKNNDMDGNDCRGMYDPVRDEIEVSEDQGEVNMKRSLLHEILHKCFSAISGDLQKVILGEEDMDALARREELVVGYLEPLLYDVLVRNGWLKFPEPPKRPNTVKKIKQKEKSGHGDISVQYAKPKPAKKKKK